MRKYITEFTGTFFLVFVIGLSDDQYIAVGGILTALVYMGFHVSGAHYNPAVTLAVWLLKKISLKEAAIYVIFQVLGALLAALVFYLFFGKSFAPAVSNDIHILKSLFIEGAFTFLLVMVILNVAFHPKTTGNSYYGLAIGFTIMAASYAGGPVTGGAFNPAVGFGPLAISALMDGGTMQDLWVYLLGPFGGGAIAVVLFKTLLNKHSVGE